MDKTAIPEPERGPLRAGRHLVIGKDGTHIVNGILEDRLHIDLDETMLEVLTPFLSRNANLMQISNEAYRLGMPPDGLLAEPARVIPLSEKSDHTPLVNNREVAGVLLQKQWIDVDVQSHLCGGMDKAIDEIVRRIDQEIRKPS